METTNQVCCPKCSSTQISANNRRYMFDRPIFGRWRGNDLIITCLNCGNQFKPGEKRRAQADIDAGERFSGKVLKIFAWIVLPIFLLVSVIFFYEHERGLGIFCSLLTLIAFKMVTFSTK